MGRVTLARLEIYGGLAALAIIFALAGYGLVARLADRLDPKLRACIERNMQGRADEKPMTREFAEALCRRLQANGAIER
jgi:hypothetical protein